MSDRLRMYDNLDPVEAVIKAWNSPGLHPEFHRNQQEKVRKSMPLLARALDRLDKK